MKKVLLIGDSIRAGYDLYALLESVPREQHSDQTHYYTREATELIAGRVISVVGKALQIQARELDYDEMFRDKTDIVGL